MNLQAEPPTDGTAGEISALIETLHQTSQRIEELTAGQVDTVADHEGRSFLLRPAQDYLRHNEAAKQAAILNALPAHVALLDAQGLIISVNDAWHRFTGELPIGRGSNVRPNYLTICDSWPATDLPEIAQIAAGVRSVLFEGAKGFSIEYFWHSPSGPRWYLMTVAPLASDHPNGAVVMHLDITERKDGEQALRRFAGAMEAMADAIYLVDRRSMRLVHVNDAACRLHQLSREDLLALTPWAAQSTTRIELERTYDAITARGEDPKPLEMTWPSEDGASTWIEVRRSAQRFAGRWTMVTLIRDITERRRAEDSIVRLNRVYALLSGVNALIVRSRDPNELFKEACQIAVAAGFPLAWVGICDRAAMKIVPMAWDGAGDGYVDQLPLGLADTRSLLSRAVEDRQVVIGNDMRRNPNPLLREEALKRGFRSMVVLPLLVAGAAVGVLTLYADEFDYFTEDEVKLLSQLAGDISFALESIEKQERLNYLAYYDVLTGLANRSLFLDRVSQHVSSAADDEEKLAVYLIDLERFKNLNDSLGRSAGDALLKQVAVWLSDYVGGSQLTARVGADVFAVILANVTQDADVARLLERTMAAFLEHSFLLNETAFRISAKAGVAVFPDDGDNAETLFKNAEAALKKAQAGSDRYLFYTQKMTDAVAGRLTLENQLRIALDREQFVLHYQPKVNLESGKLTGAEALIRWDDPRTGLVPPARFIAVLEETGMIHEVGRWALRKAIEDSLRWHRAGFSTMRTAVNVSPLQLQHRDFVTELEQAISIDPGAATRLELEITENLIMEDVKGSIATLQAIRAMGISIAIDDFGTGFSSLGYLAKLPVDTLKIDHSFVVEMVAESSALALVSTIISLAHSLKLKVVAEGVETEEQARLLRLLGCDEMQGFLFSPGVPSERFEANYLSQA